MTQDNDRNIGCGKLSVNTSLVKVMPNTEDIIQCTAACMHVHTCAAT